MEEEKIRIDKDDEEENITFETAKNFDGLYDLIKKFDKIIGSGGKEYDPDRLIYKIESFRTKINNFQKKGGIAIQLTREGIKNLIEDNTYFYGLICRVTKSKGLRDRVMYLTIDEVINQAVSKKIKG